MKKIAKIKDVDNFINGFLKGTPLAFLFDNKKITDREKVLLYIKRELISEYGASKLSIPMQALVYQGIK
ncbi:MAG TPA: hypothetical protein VGO09_11690 [Flavisolibacter sp.]|nr:hypothetical protein [Flavisolibacter sp.]